MSIFNYYETTHLTRQGMIKPQTGCPFIYMCKTNERCPTNKKTYEQEFSCAFARALAIEYHEEIKKQREEKVNE